MPRMVSGGEQCPNYLPQEPFPTFPSLELLPWPLLADLLAINTQGLSALVPLNELISSTREHFSFLHVLH